MPPFLTPTSMGGTLSERGNAILHVLATWLSRLAFYVALSGMVWVLGKAHHLMHGGEMAWFDDVLTGHPFAVSTGIHVLAGISYLISRRPESAAPDGTRAPGTAESLYAEACTMALGPVPDLAGAHARLVRAHASGSPLAARALGDWSLHGIVVPQDDAAAFAYLQESATADVPEGLHRLGTCRERGIGCQPDAGAAYRHYLRAALFGSREAAADVARCLRDGTGVAADAEAARAWRDSPLGPAPGWRERAWPWDLAASPSRASGRA